MNPENEHPEIKVQLSPEQYLNHLVNLTTALLRNPVYIHEDCGHLLTVADRAGDDPEDVDDDRAVVGVVASDLLEQLIGCTEVFVEDHLKDNKHGKN